MTHNKSSVEEKNIERPVNTDPLTLNLNIKSTKVDNVPVWFVEDESSDLACFSLTFKNSGSAYEDQPGSAGLLAAMMNEGAGDMNAKEFKEYLLNNLIQFYVSVSYVECVFTVRTVQENLDKAVEIIRLVITSLRLAEEDLERIKQEKILDLEQSLHNHSSVAFEALTQFAFKQHPYFKKTQDVIKSLKVMSASILSQHIKNFFAQDNMQMVFVGHTNQKDVEKYVSLLKKDLSSARAGTKVDEVSFQNFGKTGSHFMDIPQSVMLFVTPSIERKDPDFYALLLWNSVLGDRSVGSSRFWDEIREKRGLAYYVGTDIIVSEKLNAIKGIAGVKTENVAKTIDIAKEEFKKAHAQGVTQKEFDIYKKRLIGVYQLRFDSLLGITSALTQMMNMGLTVEDVLARNKKIDELTIENVNAAAKKHIDPQKMVFMMVGRHK